MIESLIGYSFKNKGLLKQALTHPSYSTSDFQVFEFLGDRILGIVIADILFKNQKNIKKLAHEFANLVNTDALVKVALIWQIEQYLNHNIEFVSNKVLADAVEAIIAAIYLDSNFETVYKILKSLYSELLQSLEDKIEPKMYLQEFSQSKFLGLPIYEIVKIEGKDHKKCYTIKVSIDNFGHAIGVGSSKHEASKLAAQKLIELLNEKN